MKIDITLEEYLHIGGKIEKINWSDAYCDYGDKNRDAKVVSYEDKGDKNKYNDRLFYFTFSNGNTQRYAISWIKVKVEFTLSDKYK